MNTFGSLSEGQLKHSQSEEIQELYRQLEDKDRIFENYKKSRGGLEVFFRQVLSSIQPMSPLPVLFKPEASKSKPTAIAVNQTSDSHMGAVQPSYEVAYLNGYNPTVCGNRNIGYSLASSKYINTLRNGYVINELHWLFTGDLISGDIHEELKITNAFPSPVQVVQAAKLHAAQVGVVAPMYERIVVHFVTADNHARLTKKPQSGEEGFNSMNYLVGIMMKEYLRKHTNVEFNLHPVYEANIDIGNMKYLVTHGHGIKGWAGIPWYGIERKVSREATFRMAEILMSYDQDKALKELGFHKMVHGHFHTDLNTPTSSCAASVQGGTTFDLKNARMSKPGQPTWLIGEHGEFARTNFNLNVYDNEDLWKIELEGGYQ